VKGVESEQKTLRKVDHRKGDRHREVGGKRVRAAAQMADCGWLRLQARLSARFEAEIEATLEKLPAERPSARRLKLKTTVPSSAQWAPPPVQAAAAVAAEAGAEAGAAPGTPVRKEIAAASADSAASADLFCSPASADSTTKDVHTLESLLEHICNPSLEEDSEFCVQASKQASRVAAAMAQHCVYLVSKTFEPELPGVQFCIVI
jgi:hypothetical protein